MRYRTNPKNGDQLSALAYGCMRFPRDEAEAERLVLRAVEGGVNYFDTAYIYPGSEAALGRILHKNGLRPDVKIATKLPGYLVRRHQDLDRILSAELARLQTDWIDYYLIHMLTGLEDWLRLTSLGIVQWITEKRRDGVIRNIGFSFHGGAAAFQAVVDAFAWEFCMIQYNYYDEHAQAGREGLLYAAAKGLPVMIMEPLRGGALVNLTPEAGAAFREANPAWSPAEWGLRWVLNHPQVTTALSGMGSMEMVEENLRIASEAEGEAMTPSELEACGRVRDILRAATNVPCTGCNYCMPCPAGVDIPLCFTHYNDLALMPGRRARVNYATRVLDREASRCTRCGKCVSRCPQSIPIPQKLEEATRALERPWLRPIRFVARRAMRNR